MVAELSQSIRLPSPLPVSARLSTCGKSLSVWKCTVRKHERRLSSSCKTCHGSDVVNTSFLPPSFHEVIESQTALQDVEHSLNGRCIYLVGLMGSGKTTVGKIMAEDLHYSFCDCDSLITQTVKRSVSEIFETFGEPFFRDKETETLKNLSHLRRFVVSTGGGAVERPINWSYMRSGISVWLDVPLHVLAERIASVGTASRPLLHSQHGDVYSKTLDRLSQFLHKRHSSYAKANVQISLQNIALKYGYKDVASVSPSEIAQEAFLQIKNHVLK